jgi:carboxyl-terminal processing protease
MGTAGWGNTHANQQYRFDIQNDAYALLDLIETRFAYADRFPNYYIPVRAELQNQIPYLQGRNDLIGFAQTAFHALYDHHSIAGVGLLDDYALVPSFADLWIEKTVNGYEIMDVRKGSPALRAGLRPGCLLTWVEGRPVEEAISEFIGYYPYVLNDERQAYAARVLAAGKKGWIRKIGVHCEGLDWTVEIPTLYHVRLKRDKGLLSTRSVSHAGRRLGIIRINDSLSYSETVQAFDYALNTVSDVDGLVLDLRDTASGGNTLVARGILSRFVSEATPYQRHELPSDQRDFGVKRSWTEEVTPRGWQFKQPVAVVSGRWTASMGEGLTVGFDAIGAGTFGTDMSRLLGGITDHKLPASELVVKLTTEKLFHMDGTPRELFRPRTGYFNFADAPGDDGQDGPLNAALDYLSQH